MGISACKESAQAGGGPPALVSASEIAGTHRWPQNRYETTKILQKKSSQLFSFHLL